ncbi:MAG: InlB B-repeat-containing protein [Synergistaceae bacterium]
MWSETIQTNTYSNATVSYSDVDDLTVRFYFTINSGGGITCNGDNRAWFEIWRNGSLLASQYGIAVNKSSGSIFSLGQADVNRGGFYNIKVYIPSAGSNSSLGVQAINPGFNYRIVYDYNETPTKPAPSSKKNVDLSPQSTSVSLTSGGGNLAGSAILHSWKGSFGERGVNESANIEQSETLYAVWKYCLSCNANGGSGGFDQWVYKKHGVSNILPSAPTRTGYSFKNWGGYSPGSSSVNNATNFFAFGTPVNGTVTLYANWDPEHYTITFDKQGGSGNIDPVSVVYNTPMNSISPPTREGYTFNGYYSSTNGNGTIYYNANGTAARAWDNANSGTLYAYWTLTPYTVTFDKQGGSGGTSSVTGHLNNQLSQITVPTRLGYTFNGYYSSTSGGTKFYDDKGVGITFTSTSSVILYAQWTATTVTLNDAFAVYGVTYNSAYSDTKYVFTALKTSANNPILTLGLSAGVFSAIKSLIVTITYIDRSVLKINDYSFTDSLLTITLNNSSHKMKTINIAGEYNNTSGTTNQINSTYYFHKGNGNVPVLNTTSSGTQYGIYFINYVSPQISNLSFDNYVVSGSNITGFNVNARMPSISVFEDFGLYKKGTKYAINNGTETELLATNNFRYNSASGLYQFQVSGLTIPTTTPISLTFTYVDFNGEVATATISQTHTKPSVDIYKKQNDKGTKEVGIGIGCETSEVNKLSVGWDAEFKKDLKVTANVTLTEPLSISSGGTGGHTADGARINLGAAPVVHNHVASEIVGTVNSANYAANAGYAANTDKLQNIGLSQHGNRYGVIPSIGDDGVMEAGNIIDFHASDNDTGDFSARIMNTGNDLVYYGKGSAYYGVQGAVSRARGQFTVNANLSSIIANAFTTNLGNGYFRIDISGKWYVYNVDNVDYGINKPLLKKLVYQNIMNPGTDAFVQNISGSVELQYLPFPADVQIWNVSGGAYGLTAADYGWALDNSHYSYILGRMYTTNGDVGGWNAKNVNEWYVSGFYFKATIFVRRV